VVNNPLIKYSVASVRVMALIRLLSCVDSVVMSCVMAVVRARRGRGVVGGKPGGGRGDREPGTAHDRRKGRKESISR